MPRRALTVAVTLLAAAVAMLLPSPAMATYASGNVGETVNYATGTQIWDAEPETYTLKMYPTSTSSLPSNYCFDSFLDWKTGGGHWDIRIARTCDPDIGFGKSGDDTNTTRALFGANRLATCKGGINQTTTGTCVNHSQADMGISGASDNLGSNYVCARGWDVWLGGSGPHYYSGGNSWDCYS